jgi:hypothetical protein
VKQFFTKNGMTQLLHPPYSPDLAPCDFLLPRMKEVLKGKRFADVEEVNTKTTEALEGITLREFQDCFETFTPVHCIKWTGTLKEIKFVTPQNKYTIFITKFRFLLGPYVRPFPYRF